MLLLDYWLFQLCNILVFGLLKEKNSYVKRIVFLLFVYIKTFLKPKQIVYKCKSRWLTSAKDNVHVFIYTKSKNNCETFLYKTFQTLCKKQDNLRSVFIYKKRDTLRYAVFHEIFKLAFIYKNHDTFRYVKFLYTKSQTLRKKQDNFRYVFIYKKHNTLCYAIYHGIFEIGGGGEHFYMQKNAPCVTFLCAKDNSLCVTFLNKKSRHFVLHFYIQKTMPSVLRFISNIYRMVLIPTYKGTYN